MSVFHRVDDPMQLDSPRYFRLAERLVHYDGALRHALAAELERRSPPAPVQPGAAPAAAVTPTNLSGAALAAMTDHQSQGGNFPGIEYSGG